jgi:proline iminopeptidase
MTPDQYTRKELNLEVGDGHTLYVQDWGSDAVDAPVIVHLHGGPGSGSGDKFKEAYDPAHQRVIFFDQRGCGKSTPYGSLENNTTDDLVQDINKITEALGIDTFTVAGGSWGSTLALVYAIRNPERVERMVIRGIFTGRQSEIDFMEQGGFKAFFPEVWEQFAQSVPAEFYSKPRDYHMPRVLGDDQEAAKASAYAYHQLEGSILRLDDRLSATDYETFDPVSSKIECHYMHNACFIPEGYIMNNAHKLTMPIYLLQGRYDAICPPITAYELSQKLPNSQLFWTTAGHSGSDRANWDLARSLLLT